jgi:trehalose-6-phosphatase
VVGAFSGAWIEPKPLAFTVHLRALGAPAAEDLEREVRRALAARGPALRIVKASAALEVLPRVGWDKGSVVRLLHAGSTGGCGLFFAGDSAGDAEAVEAVVSLGGLAVGVGPDAPPGCSRLLTEPSSLAELLETVLANLRKEASPG